ncbi:MAG: hypothetical protein AAGE01_10910 [Pseudomonadota bacterium]
MAQQNDETFRLKVRDAGSLEIPADIVRRLGLAPGALATLRLSGGKLEIGEQERNDQFVSWREISHDLLSKPAA